MSNDFRSARFWAKEIIENAVGEGSRVIDATMGNGYDTLWLCNLVGDTGRVYAFDIQPEAVTRTGERLKAEGVEARAVLLCAGHETMAEHVPEQVDAVLFNLGWLPGAEHGVTTRTETTLKAVNAALTLLKEDAVMTVCVYPGHEEGTRELHALLEWAAALDEKRFDAMHKTYLNQSNDPPHLIAVKKKLTRRQKGTGK